MINESLLEKTIKELNRKWYQSDQVYRWMLTEEKGVLHIKRNIKVASTSKKTHNQVGQFGFFKPARPPAYIHWATALCQA